MTDAYVDKLAVMFRLKGRERVMFRLRVRERVMFRLRLEIGLIRGDSEGSSCLSETLM